jgi:hypothetical protein
MIGWAAVTTETNMQTIWYRVIDHCEASYYDIELPVTYDLTRPMEQTLIAARCAEDYHSNHDGWESNWPLTFALHATEEGPEVARLEIDREAVPHFYASHVKTPNVELSDQRGFSRRSARTHG